MQPLSSLVELWTAGEAKAFEQVKSEQQKLKIARNYIFTLVFVKKAHLCKLQYTLLELVSV